MTPMVEGINTLQQLLDLSDDFLYLIALAGCCIALGAFFGTFPRVGYHQGGLHSQSPSEVCVGCQSLVSTPVASPSSTTPCSRSTGRSRLSLLRLDSLMGRCGALWMDGSLWRRPRLPHVTRKFQAASLAGRYPGCNPRYDLVSFSARHTSYWRGKRPGEQFPEGLARGPPVRELLPKEACEDAGGTGDSVSSHEPCFLPRAWALGFR